MTDRAIVPCNGCFACCHNDTLVLHPEMGDDATQYETYDIAHPITGEPAKALRHKPNGDCIYLDRATGCTIHDRAPAICREYDCRKMYQRLLTMNRAERRKLVYRGILSKEQIKAGRERLGTLP